MEKKSFKESPFYKNWYFSLIFILSIILLFIVTENLFAQFLGSLIIAMTFYFGVKAGKTSSENKLLIYTFIILISNFSISYLISYLNNKITKDKIETSGNKFDNSINAIENLKKKANQQPINSSAKRFIKIDTNNTKKDTLLGLEIIDDDIYENMQNNTNILTEEKDTSPCIAEITKYFFMLRGLDEDIKGLIHDKVVIIINRHYK